MTCCIECPDRWRRPLSIKFTGRDETISFAVGMPTAQERETRCASGWRSSNGIDRIPLSELAIADPARAAGMISMRSVSGVAVAFY